MPERRPCRIYNGSIDANPPHYAASSRSGAVAALLHRGSGHAPAPPQGLSGGQIHPGFRRLRRRNRYRSDRADLQLGCRQVRARKRLRPHRRGSGRRLQGLRGSEAARGKGHSRGWAYEARHDSDRIHRGSRQLQDRADRAQIGSATLQQTGNSSAAAQRNVPGAPATRYLRTSLCCPISALAKSSSMSSLTSCAGMEKYSTPRPKRCVAWTCSLPCSWSALMTMSVRTAVGTMNLAPMTKPLALFFSSSTNLTLLSHRDSRIRCIAGGMSFSITMVSGPAHLTKKCIVSKYSLSLMRFFR